MGEKLLSMLRVAETGFISKDLRPYSPEYKQQILEFMNTKLLDAIAST